MFATNSQTVEFNLFYIANVFFVEAFMDADMPNLTKDLACSAQGTSLFIKVLKRWYQFTLCRKRPLYYMYGSLLCELIPILYESFLCTTIYGYFFMYKVPYITFLFMYQAS